MNKAIVIAALVIASIPHILSAQTPDLSVMYFGASKSHNAGTIIDDSTGESFRVTREESAVYWMGVLALADGDSIAVDGQYGHRAIYRVLPPDPQAWWVYPRTSLDRQWDGSIAASGYDKAIITEGSFLATWLPPDSIAPGVKRVTDFVRNTDSGGVPELPVYLYMLWPRIDTWRYGNGGPLLIGEPYLMPWDHWVRFNELCAGTNITGGYSKGWPAWWEDIQDLVNADIAGPPVRLFPASIAVGKMFLELDALSEVGPREMLRDDAGHGTPSMYFLYGMVHYMAMFNRKPVADIQLPETIIAPIRDNYTAIRDFAWDVLETYDSLTGRLSANSGTVNAPHDAATILPVHSPVRMFASAQQLRVEVPNDARVSLIGMNGMLIQQQRASNGSVRFTTSGLHTGMYLVHVRSGVTTQIVRYIKK